jgi:hypothetical protein
VETGPLADSFPYPVGRYPTGKGSNWVEIGTFD